MTTILTVALYFYMCHNYRLDFEIANSDMKAEELYYNPRRSLVNIWDKNFIISGQNICYQTKPYLLLLVITIPKNLAKRNAIRETWTKPENWPNFEKSFSIKTVFLFGKYKDFKENSLVLNESKKYGDIVTGNFIDSYRNLTLKVLTGLYWVRRYCAGATFISKMDDDTFVNIPLLYKHLQVKPQLNYMILGHLVMNAQPERKGKYYVSYKSFPLKFYPPYAVGNLYTAKSETFFAILDIAPYQPWIEMEDVFVTGILAKITKVQHRAYPRGMYFTEKAAAACEFVKNTKVFSKEYDSKDVRKAWEIIQNPIGKCR